MEMLLLGVDIGSTNIKAAVFERAGRAVQVKVGLKEPTPTATLAPTATRAPSQARTPLDLCDAADLGELCRAPYLAPPTPTPLLPYDPAHATPGMTYRKP
jgi:hypothetical protein